MANTSRLIQTEIDIVHEQWCRDNGYPVTSHKRQAQAPRIKAQAERLKQQADRPQAKESRLKP